jgi:hypothetical protein
MPLQTEKTLIMQVLYCNIGSWLRLLFTPRKLLAVLLSIDSDVFIGKQSRS